MIEGHARHDASRRRTLGGAACILALLLSGWDPTLAGAGAQVDVSAILAQSRKAADEAHVHSSTKVDLYNRLGRSFAMAGERNEAQASFAAARRALDADGANPEYRTGMLVGIGLEQAEAGFTDAARKTLRDAVMVTREIHTSSGAQAYAMRQVVEAYAKIGDFDAAMKLAARVPGGLERSYAFQSVAVAQIQRGDEAGMRAALGRVKAHGYRATVLRRIAEAQVAKGDRVGALESASEARRAAALATGKSSRSHALLDALHAQVAVGDVAGAEETAKAIAGVGYPEHREKAWRTVGLAEARAGAITDAARSLASALEAASELPTSGVLIHGSPRMAALIDIGKDQAAAGLADDARKTAALITQTHPGATHNEITVLLEIAKAEFARGDRERAAKFWDEAVRVSEPESSRVRVDHLARIAAARATAGDPGGGVALARAYPVGDERDKVLRSVALASAEVDDAKTATAALSEMSVEGRPHARVWRLAALQAEAGDFEAALTTAAAIDREDWKGLYIYRIARTQAAAGHPADALKWVLTESVPLVKANGLLGVADGVLTKRAERGPVR